MKIFKDLRKKQIALFIICVLTVTADVFLTFQVQGLVDAIVDSSDFSLLLHVFLRISIIGLVYFILSLYQTRRWHYFRYELINTMRFKMYNSLIKKPISFFNKYTTGDLASKVLNDGSLIAESAGIQILMIILNIFRVALVLGVLFYFNVKLALVVAPLLPLYYLLLRRINGKMRRDSMEERAAFGSVQQMLIENIKGIKDIVMLNKYNYFSNIFNKALNENYFSKIKRIVNTQVLMYALNSVMVIFLPVLVLLIGGYFAYSGEITVGVLITFYTYLNKLIEPIGNLADAYQGSRMALGSADRVYDFIFDNNTELRNEVLDEDFKDLNININSFSWNDLKVLSNLNFTINFGDKLFIKGESGKGKSTLLSLLMNFYSLDQGNITINNKDISKISKESLYKNILELPQEPFIFEGTIRENLSLGDTYSDDDLKEVLEIACIDDLVNEKGLDYILTESGANISGGQKQRIALARVLLRKPKILVLDEATSALDKTTEEKLLINLNKYLDKNGITLISVSHNDKIREICNKELAL